MLSLKDIKIETKLRLLVGVSVLGLLSFAVVSYITIAKVKVGGLVQTEVKLYSDLAADTMPPALDFERVRFAARDMLIFNSRKLPEKIALYNQRKQEYEDAVASWSKRLPQGAIQGIAAGRRRPGQSQVRGDLREPYLPRAEKGRSQ